MTDSLTASLPALTDTHDFSPPAWLANPHLQSILPSLRVRRPLILRRARQLLACSRDEILDCGQGVRLLGHYSSRAVAGHAPARDLVVLLHGWEGSADSTYLLSLAQTLFAEGFEVVRLNLRDHGATHHLNRELFHSCRLPEVVGAMRALATRFPGLPMLLAGFSLGGNFMLRVAAHPDGRHLPIERVLAISPVLDPAATLLTLERGLGVYHGYFVRKWCRSLARKQMAWPELYDFEDLLKVGSLREMTRQLVRSHTEYPSMDDYLAGYAITGGRLTTLSAPATVLTALDDPIIDAVDLSRLARSPHLDIRTTAHGGHCGFIESLGETTWIDAQARKLLSRNPDS